MKRWPAACSIAWKSARKFKMAAAGCSLCVALKGQHYKMPNVYSAKIRDYKQFALADMAGKYRIMKEGRMKILIFTAAFLVSQIAFAGPIEKAPDDDQCNEAKTVPAVHAGIVATLKQIHKDVLPEARLSNFKFTPVWRQMGGSDVGVYFKVSTPKETFEMLAQFNINSATCSPEFLKTQRLEN